KTADPLLNRSNGEVFEPHTGMKQRRVVAGHHKRVLAAAVDSRRQRDVAIGAGVANGIAEQLIAGQLAPAVKRLATQRQRPLSLPTAILTDHRGSMTKAGQDQRLPMP